MTHNEAICIIRDGGLYVRLLLRKTNAPPPSLDGKTRIKQNRKIRFFLSFRSEISHGTSRKWYGIL
jgi:hypothetical protein